MKDRASCTFRHLHAILRQGFRHLCGVFLASCFPVCRIFECGLPGGGVAHTKNEKTQKRTKLTAIPLLRAVAPASPMLLFLNQSFWSVLFSYTGTWHDMGGLPGRGVAHTKNEKTQKRTKLTAIPLLRAVAPASPMLFPLNQSFWSVWFSYTGT